MMSTELSFLLPSWFADMQSLEILHIERNHLQELPTGVFGALNNLRDLYISQNNISMIDSESFGSLARLRTFNAPFNRINGIDPNFFDNAELLNSLSLYGNICNGDIFTNVQNSRDEVRQVIQPCFDRFVAESGTIECEYIEDEGVICMMTLQNRFGREFDRIGGVHLEGKTDGDVWGVGIFDQRSTIVPSRICQQFPNITILLISFSEVQVLTPEAFQNCANLQSFYVEGNPVQVVPDNLFANSPNLTAIGFTLNQLRLIEDNAFAGTSLTTVFLDCKQNFALFFNY